MKHVRTLRNNSVKIEIHFEMLPIGFEVERERVEEDKQQQQQKTSAGLFEERNANMKRERASGRNDGNRSYGNNKQ